MKIIIAVLVEKEIEVKKLTNDFTKIHKVEIESYLKYLGFKVKGIKHRFEKDQFKADKVVMLKDIELNSKGQTWKYNKNAKTPQLLPKENTSLEHDNTGGLSI